MSYDTSFRTQNTSRNMFRVKNRIRRFYPRFLSLAVLSQWVTLCFWIKPWNQGVTKRCRLSWLTNSALVYEPKCGGRGDLLGLLSQWVDRSPNKLGRSNSIFNLCMKRKTRSLLLEQRQAKGPQILKGQSPNSRKKYILFLLLFDICKMGFYPAWRSKLETSFRWRCKKVYKM